MAGTEKKPGNVILDGDLILVGGTYQDLKVIEIKDNGAVLEYQGEQQWFSSGQRTRF